MKKSIGRLLLLSLLLALCVHAAPPPSFSWGGVDGLGRTLPFTPPRTPARRRYVAMFYWPWHYNFAQHLPPRNAGEVVKLNPLARNDFNHPAWEGTPSGTSYFWGKPLFGYYSNLDTYVLEKHAVMLADAGVDVIVFDCTNGTFTWMPAVEALMQTYDRLRARGQATPQIAFMLNFAPNANTAAELRQLYRDIYAPRRHPDLWFRWQGKPLIMAHPKALDSNLQEDRDILKFFTFRRNEPTYFAKDTPIQRGVWGWCSVHPQTRFGVRPEGAAVEEMTVSVAQNATVRGLSAMNDTQGGVFGRGYAKGDYRAAFLLRNGGTARIAAGTPEAWLWGVNFQQQWDWAFRNDPELVFVTGWNEWIAGRHAEWCGTVNAFPDEFNAEFSRDIEPAAEAPYDHFYCQLVANVRRWKGGATPPPPATRLSETPSGLDSALWRSVQPSYADTVGDTPARDADGWQGIHFTQPAAPNDLVEAKAAFDAQNLYFYLRTASSMSAPDGQWMRLLLDCGAEGAWEGFNFITQWTADGRMELRRFSGSTFADQRPVTEVAFWQEGCELLVAIPRAALSLPEAAGKGLAIQFKWSDGQPLEKGALQFYTVGDTAPNSRFRFVMRGIQ